jgi:hypothetical protein
MKKIFLMVMCAVLLVGVVYAQDSGYISDITTSASVSTATTGTNFVVTATLTAGSSQVNAGQIQLVSTGQNTGSFLTINDPPTGYYSNTAISTSGTTKTFTATAGVADTYSYYVTATYTGGSKSSTATIVEFVDPSALVVTGSPSSAGSKDAGESYTLSINIQNSQDSDITTSYSLTCPSGVSCSGDPTSSSGTTIIAGTTQTLQWTVTVNSEFSGTKTVTFALGDNAGAFTSSITGTATTTTSTTSVEGTTSSDDEVGTNLTTTSTIEEGVTTTIAGNETATTVVEESTKPLVSITGDEGIDWVIITVVIIIIVAIAGYLFYNYEHARKKLSGISLSKPGMSGKAVAKTFKYNFKPKKKR